MNRREGTVGEQRYEYLCRYIIKCMACNLNGRGPIDQGEGDHIAFHHDPDFGSRKPDCHYHAFGLCGAHHQGVNVPSNSEVLVRHRNESRFIATFAEDAELNRLSWVMVAALPLYMRSYGLDQTDLMEHCPFEDLEVAA